MTHNELPWYIQHWTGVTFLESLAKDIVTLAIASFVALSGLRTYESNAATKRAELMAQLHKNFFIEPTYESIRTKLEDDTPKGDEGRQGLIDEEPEAFIQFLNFFELAAYFVEVKTLKKDDLNALLGYYLQLMKRRAPVYQYICRHDRSFENLKKLLGTLTP